MAFVWTKLSQTLIRIYLPNYNYITTYYTHALRTHKTRRGISSAKERRKALSNKRSYTIHKMVYKADFVIYLTLKGFDKAKK